jgi:hypothetical protein
VTSAASSAPPTSGRPGQTKAAARWETVTTFSATGPLETPEFPILGEAIQWRVRWSCQIGNLRITTTPPPRRPGPLVDVSCPGNDQAFSIQTGPTRLAVEASGPWKAIVDQQVDTPLSEPLPPEAASGSVLADGTFYDIEKRGKGTAKIYRLPDGSRMLRLEDFEVSQNTDLFVWLSEASRPRTSIEAVTAGKVQISNLKSTVGSQNYEIPPNVATDRIRSIVIWCEPVAVAYVAATLKS